MKRTIYLLLAAAWLLAPVRADVVEMKNGQILNGKFAGGSPGLLRFETAGGVQALDTAQVVSLTFTAPVPAAPAAPAPAAAAPAAAPANSVTLPAGTTLLVRMMDSISSKNPAGTRFTTKLEYDLAGGGVVAIPGGTMIYGKVQNSTQARRAVGRSTLDLRLTELVINNQPVPIVTSGYQQAGQASIAKAAKGAGAGAAIGAIAGDAGKGAAIGAVAGALVKGQTITIPPGTLLEFTLSKPVAF